MGSLRTKLALWILPVLLLSVLLIVGCGKDKSTDSNNNPPPNGTPGTLVVISNFTYSPSTLSISAGDTVTWRNDDSVNHTVTSDSGSELNSPLLSQGQTYTHIFNNSGNFPYHCTVHPAMTASVAVQ